MKNRLLALLLVAGVLSGCTLPQLAAIESRTGLDFDRRQTRTLRDLPNGPVVIGADVFHSDGSVTRLQPPSWSRCPEWFDDALAAGWSEAHWARLDAVIDRESRCTAGAYNGVGHDNSYGLLQLNMKAHASWVGPLVDGDFTRLYDPWTNLWVGKHLYDRAAEHYGCGWQPWSFGC